MIKCLKKKVQSRSDWQMTVNSVRRTARAKVNLTLHVTGQRADGYHLLDSLVCFADIGDFIDMREADALSLSVDGPLAAGVPTDERNLVLQAARLFGADKGAAINLSKHLPHAAGIGGGSADAAATLLALAELWDLPLPEDVVRLGADVPVCLSPMALRMRGVGDELSVVPPLPELPAVLVNPRVAVETPPVFKALTQKENAPMGVVPECADVGVFAKWCAEQRNDLQAPAISIEPTIQDALDALEPALFARMSGSGATCFGLCENADSTKELAKTIRGKHPDWWVVATNFS
ncbi:4-diphosphocytidyl-2-C-methyl-D-erythritol kinase [Planktotalea frisia]|uniref:4-diphosphocytidyl-2-C-methyl-D-erythritol kinase n=2 Tax=Planktotalea frisia TaxID=696762 RepID=A0A1L9NXR7_9RHOB|nr:4-diphosphocytidyl-2-C-methyl-D-erythritol kinase [Planktotalea frisia]PZX35278.1 4-diphosphocytidyl-2-C-methyl-D-erythritol kinase [Planktotalea frisia]